MSRCLFSRRRMKVYQLNSPCLFFVLNRQMWVEQTATRSSCCLLMEERNELSPYWKNIMRTKRYLWIHVSGAGDLFALWPKCWLRGRWQVEEKITVWFIKTKSNILQRGKSQHKGPSTKNDKVQKLKENNYSTFTW